MTLTTTTTTNKMPTTTVNAQNVNAQNVNAQKNQPKMIAKWSGSDEPQSYYNREDDDGITLKTATKWYDVKYPEYDDGDDCHSEHDDVSPIAPAAVAAPSRISSSFWTTPLSIASGQEPVFEPEYPEYEECTHVPFMNLTKEQRAEKSKNFKFGLCCDCDAGLDDKSDFVRETRISGDVKMCNACNNYHMDMFEKSVGGEHGGCN